MAEPRLKQGCPNCGRLLRQLERMEKRIAELEARLGEAQAELAKTCKNSGNSSKPPSSDIVKPKPSAAASNKTGKRKRGAQLGHPKHQRQPFDESEIDHFWDYTLSACPDCGGRVEASGEPPRLIQQVEMVSAPIVIGEHRGQACWCPNCQKTHYAPIHEDVRRAGLVGPRLTALVAYLKGGCHCSFSTIRKFLRDVVGVTISRGQLRKLCAKVSDSLQPSYEESLNLLPTQPMLNVDETGHKNNGEAMWTWCFRASLFRAGFKTL